MPTPVNPWVVAMMIATQNIRHHPDLVSLCKLPLMIKGQMPTFIGLQRELVPSAGNDNASP